MNFFKSLPINIGELLLDFAQKSSDVFWIRSADYSKQIYLSPSYETIWGRPCGTLYDNPGRWSDTLHPEDKIRLDQSVSLRPKEVTPQTSYLEEYRIIRPDNEIRWIRDESFALFDQDNNHIGFAGVAQDITREKALLALKEQAESANRAKSEFLASISHDLRTPLSSIINVAELLQHRHKNSQDNELFSMLTQSSRSLLELIEEILAFTKLEAGKLPLRHESFDFRQLIEEVVNTLAPQARHKNVNIIIDYHDFIVRHFVGDPFRIRRILINLINNAIKFTEEGHIIIAVEEVNQCAQQVEIQLSIEDTGIGIPSDQLDKVFERFTKVEGSYHGRYGGSGLGLTITKQLVEDMGGRINLNSQLGVGSTFYCTLVFEKQTIHHKHSIWQRHYQNVRLLVIDDHQAHGENTVKQLGTAHVNLVNSRQAKETMLTAQIDNKPYDVIIIDDQIEYLKAFELARWINYHITDHEPMILFSLLPTKDNVLKKATHLGYDYLIKPLQPTEISQKLAECWQSWLAQKLPKKQQIRAFAAHVMLVEDEPTNQKVVSILLQDELGCQVKIAASGKQAIDLFKLNDFDLILMDVGLPDQSGIEVTKQLIELDDDSQPTPIFGLTAHASEESKQECLAAGMQGQLTKPASLDALEKVIGQCMLPHRQEMN